MGIQPLRIETASEPLDHDPKKYWWLNGLSVPIAPLVTALIYAFGGWAPITYLLPVFVFVIIPLEDLRRGVDNENLTEEFMESIKNSRYYRVIVELYVPFQYLAFFVSMWQIAQPETTLAAKIGLTLSVGISAGIAINAAHEMGHKPDGFQQWVSRISLAQSAYGHFYVEHNRGHHRRVATPEDPASARYGESFYAFFVRTVVFSAVSAWSLEADRLNRMGKPAIHWTNKNLQSWAMTVALFGGTIAWLGSGVIWPIVIQAIIGFGLLELVNYLEHYGLLRPLLPSGRYAKCEPCHSWNSNFRLTNLYLYHLQRHSDHHANPLRPYQILRNYDDAPNLPAGYGSMILVALVPPLWFRVMDPRVADVYDGDLSKANLTKRRRAKLATAST